MEVVLALFRLIGEVIAALAVQAYDSFNEEKR